MVRKKRGSMFLIIIRRMSSFLGIDKFFKKKKEEKEAEEKAIIENSELVLKLKRTINNLEGELERRNMYASRKLNVKEQEIKILRAEVRALQEKLYRMEERKKRAILVHSDIEDKIDAILAQEKVEEDKKTALEIEQKMMEVSETECTKENLHVFETVWSLFENLSSEQKRYISSEVIERVKELRNKCAELQKWFEQQEKIKRDKREAENVEKLILGVLCYKVTRYALFNLTSVCEAYDRLTDDQKKYITADVETLRQMRQKAQQFQDEYEEEMKKRKNTSDNSVFDSDCHWGG